MNPWVIAFPCLMYLGSVSVYSSFPRAAAALTAKVNKIVMSILFMISSWKSAIVPSISFFSISVSLNVTLTLMIVLRIVLHGRSVRTATGSRAGISGLYKTIATMLIESCALFAVSSLFVIGTMATKDVKVGNLVLPVLTEIQVRAFPHPKFLDGLSYV